jgi:hypothetical protein
MTQSFIEGFTVLTGLHAPLVTARFLPSRVLVTTATAPVLLLRPSAPARRPDSPPRSFAA